MGHRLAHENPDRDFSVDATNESKVLRALKSSEVADFDKVSRMRIGEAISRGRFNPNTAKQVGPPQLAPYSFKLSVEFHWTFDVG